jgi:hypothetical protein
MSGKIGSTQLTGIVFDSGAAMSCLSAEVFNKLESRIKGKLTRSGKQKQLTNATGGAMTSLGELKITVELEGPEPSAVFMEVSVVVVNNLQSEMLFGSNAITREKFKGYQVDFERNCIVFVDKQKQDTFASINQVSNLEVWTSPIPVYLTQNTRVPAHSSVVT